MLKWICTLSEMLPLGAALSAAVDEGRLELVKWIIQQPGVVSYYVRIFLDCACVGGHVEVVKWVVQHYPTNCLTDIQAASDGRLDIVRLLHENNIGGCSRRAMAFAASQGHFDIVKWLRNCKHYVGE
ncbi:hypothetical protein L917_00519 [Phytophthora nicotianae]|uniref:Uncharacterized protein n=1 Tax=Phytophthora nicotianae TaxID=4792 RepID=W2M0P2_PHYNI|nr:hypothetical protein L917_00519 [Phytophthora nicotianae]